MIISNHVPYVTLFCTCMNIPENDLYVIILFNYYELS